MAQADDPKLQADLARWPPSHLVGDDYKYAYRKPNHLAEFITMSGLVIQVRIKGLFQAANPANYMAYGHIQHISGTIPQGLSAGWHMVATCHGASRNGNSQVFIASSRTDLMPVITRVLTS